MIFLTAAKINLKEHSKILKISCLTFKILYPLPSNLQEYTMLSGE